MLRELILFEYQKIINKRSSFSLLLATTILFPIALKVLLILDVREANITISTYANYTAYAILGLCHIYFSLPVWAIIFVGLEFGQGHVHRVIFLRGRKFYFFSKITYCILISTFFTVLGLITSVWIVQTSPFEALHVDGLFYINLFIQLFLSSFGLSVLLLLLVTMVQSPIVAFVIFSIWGFVEGILFRIVDKVYDIKLGFLPLHLVRTVYCQQGDPKLENYYLLFDEGIIHTIPLIGFTSILIFIIYKRILGISLNSLSD